MAWYIYTDGASRGNPGPTSWAFAVYENDTEYKGSKSGYLGKNTNNVGELTALIEAMKYSRKLSGTITIYMDSSYVLNSVTNWVHGWAKNGWRKADGKPVKNESLMAEILGLKLELGERIIYKKVAGHAGVAGNEKADEICNKVLDNNEE